MEQARYDVFISYSRKDSKVADRIVQAFNKAGITCFIDRQAISGGMEFPAILAKAIKESKVFLFLASNNSYSSKFTQSEIVYAFNKKQKQDIIPYIIDGSTLPDELEFTFSAINWRRIEDHPIETVLVNDILSSLGRENDTSVKDEGTVIEAARENDPSEILEDEELHPVQVYGRWGFENDKGEVKVLTTYPWKDAEEFSEGLAAVMDDNDNWGFIDKTEKLIVPCQWNLVGNFHEGLAWVRDFDYADSNYIFGYIGKTGRVAIPCQWSDTFGFSEGVAGVKNKYGKWGFIDKTGKVVIPCQWQWTDYFSGGLAAVKNSDGKWGFINKMGEVVIPCQWSSTGRFSEGLAMVENNYTKCGYIDKRGKVVIPCQWSFAYDFSGGLASVTDDDGKQWIIDKTGKVIREK